MKHFLTLAIIAGCMLLPTSLLADENTAANRIVVVKDRAEFKIGSDVVGTAVVGRDYSFDTIAGESLYIPGIGNALNGNFSPEDGAFLSRDDSVPYEKAEDHFNSKIEDDPSSDNYYSRAMFWRYHDDWDKALADISEAIQRDPEQAAFFLCRGDVKANKGDFAGARQDFDEAIKLDPNDSYAYQARGNAKEALKDHSGAIRDYDLAISLKSNDSFLYLIRAVSKAMNHDYRGATADCDHVLKLSPNDLDAHSIRGISKAQLKDYDGALQDLDKVLLESTNLSLAQSERGFVKHLMQDFEGAISDYDKALSIDPNSNTTSWQKAFLLATCPNEAYRDAKTSLILADTAMAIDSACGYSMNAKACALALNGKFAEAIKLEEKASSDADWIKDADMGGGIMAPARIAKWKKKTLWLSHEGTLPAFNIGRIIDIGTLGQAQVSSDKKMAKLAIQTYKTEHRSRVISRTVYSTETRTKTLPRPDGLVHEVTYTLQVPTTVQEEQTYTARTPDGVTRLTIPLNQLRAWDLSGNPIATNQLATKLAGKTPVLSSENERTVSFTPIDPSYVRMLRKETIVIYLPEGASAKFEDKSPNTK